jgi:hypothetical protein
MMGREKERKKREERERVEGESRWRGRVFSSLIKTSFYTVSFLTNQSS